MAATEHSLCSIESERLRKSFPFTAHALDVANAVPASATHHAFNLLQIAIPQSEPTPNEIKRFGGLYRARERTLIRDLKKRTEGWGNAAWNYVFEPPFVEEKDDRYFEVTALRALLTSVAEQNAGRIRKDSEDKTGKEHVILTLPPAIGLLARLTISDKQSRIEPDEASLLQGLLEEGQLGRLKRCAYERCQRLFWAGRIDRPCCQASCRNAFKQKRHREREKQNRVAKKALKRGKRNG